MVGSTVSSTLLDFQKADEEQILCLCVVTFDQKIPKLNRSQSTARNFMVDGEKYKLWLVNTVRP